MTFQRKIVLLFFIALFFPSTAFAQSDFPTDDSPSVASASASPTPSIIPSDQLNLTLSPIVAQLTAKPGETVTTEIRIRNNGQKPEPVQIYSLPLEAEARTGKPKIRERRGDDIYLDWVQFSQTEFVIEPQEWQSIKVTFQPPKEAAFSYYYALTIERTSAKTNNGNTTQISGAPAILLLATVDSPFAKRELSLEAFGVKHSLVEFLPQTFEVEIENIGNVHTTPMGNIFIDGQGKKDLTVLPLNPNSGVVLPNSTRVLEIPWSEGFPLRTKEGLSWDFSKANLLRFGRYTAHLLLVFDNGERDVPIESYVTFWVIPIRLILLVIAIPTIPALLVYLLMRWQQRKRIQVPTTPAEIRKQ
ncbi:hypothetical protein KBD71_01550 [Candidatus Woesebacteria bacterium]|nr:hypothetical protein [Candidatus Woesebacteria bacterium]